MSFNGCPEFINRFLFIEGRVLGDESSASSLVAIVKYVGFVSQIKVG